MLPMCVHTEHGAHTPPAIITEYASPNSCVRSTMNSLKYNDSSSLLTHNIVMDTNTSIRINGATWEQERARARERERERPTEERRNWSTAMANENIIDGDGGQCLMLMTGQRRWCCCSRCPSRRCVRVRDSQCIPVVNVPPRVAHNTRARASVCGRCACCRASRTVSADNLC